MDDVGYTILVALWVVVIAQGLLLIGTLRQLGRISRRLGGEHPMDRPAAIEIGDILPESIRHSPDVARRVVLFVSPSCGVCGEVLNHLAAVIPDAPQVVLVPNASAVEARDYLASHGLDGYPAVFDPEGAIAGAIGIREIPFAVLVDRDWRVWRTAIVNTAYQVETMLATPPIDAAEVAA